MYETNSAIFIYARRSSQRVQPANEDNAPTPMLLIIEMLAY
jgi:hypothetical protein